MVVSHRAINSPGQSPRRFLDFVFDSIPVSGRLTDVGVDNITPLWVGGGESSLSALRQLLGDAEPDVLHGRTSAFVCAECGDLGCGAVTVRIETVGGVVSWRDWGYQNNYEDGVVDLAGFPDVSFDADTYDSTLRAAATWLSTARSDV